MKLKKQLIYVPAKKPDLFVYFCDEDLEKNVRVDRVKIQKKFLLDDEELKRLLELWSHDYRIWWHGQGDEARSYNEQIMQFIKSITE